MCSLRMIFICGVLHGRAGQTGEGSHGRSGQGGAGHGTRSQLSERNRVMVLLSIRAGLRAKEIAMCTWGMLTDAQGDIGDALHLSNGASKGKRGGRVVPLNKELRAALNALKATRNGVEAGDRTILKKSPRRVERPSGNT